MSIESNKLMNLADGQVIYNDLRDRIEHGNDELSTIKSALHSKADEPTGSKTVGKVYGLQTVNGVVTPVWADPAKSGVVPKFTKSDQNVWSCDMTFAQVLAAVQDGSCDSAVYEIYQGEYIAFVLTSYYSDSINFEQQTMGLPGVFARIIHYNSTGNISDEYVGIDLQNIVSGYESSTTSEHVYAVGDLFMMNATDDWGTLCTMLYRATAPIAFYSTIVPGTNCEEITLDEAIKSLKSAITELDTDKYEKPSGGIPGTDLADSYIEEPSSEGTNGQVLTTDGNGGRSWTTVQGGGGTSDYSDLTNKPSINSVTLSGNKSLADLGIVNVEVVRLA